MKLIKPSYKIETPSAVLKEYLKVIEAAGRTCYKSEGKITPDSAGPFVSKICHVYKHESVIEHSALTVRFIVDRGVSHELVRHRLAAYSQESTRYVDYSEGGKSNINHCQFIIPCWFDSCSPLKNPSADGMRYDEITRYMYLNDTSILRDDQFNAAEHAWLNAMQHVEDTYNELRKLGWSPQQARSVLPNSTKTEIVMTANFREWRHVFKMRTSKQAHPQIREVTIPLCKEMQTLLPEVFGDLTIDE